MVRTDKACARCVAGAARTDRRKDPDAGGHCGQRPDRELELTREHSAHERVDLVDVVTEAIEDAAGRGPVEEAVRDK